VDPRAGDRQADVVTRLGSSAVARLVETARAHYADDRIAQRMLDEFDVRLREPVRIAVAGMVKAGKSTLLNALIGEAIAPTDAGECTRAVTWYRHAHTPRITALLRDGTQQRLPVGRVEGRIDLARAGLGADDVERIEVGWPAESLRANVLIDTPGIGSLSVATSERSTRFLAASDTPPEADAVIYLLRHLHATDLSFLEAFRNAGGQSIRTVSAIAVLSRADEIGSGRIDSMLSASRIAERYRRDGEMRALALGTIPVAGLLAEGGRTLREEEFAVFRRLAELDRPLRERLLVSADRFLQAYPDPVPTVTQRQRLLERFGVFGVRLGSTLVRAGASTSSELAERLVMSSGLGELESFITDQFRARATALKARAVLTGLGDLLRDRRRPGADMLRAGIERIEANLHDAAELSLLAQLRTQTTVLTAEDARIADRVVGGDGVSPQERLGLKRDADPQVVSARIDELLTRWRSLEQSPLADRATARMCRTVVRSVEGAASDLGDGVRSPLRDVVTLGAPA
jgi:hypothetical protein